MPFMQYIASRGESNVPPGIVTGFHIGVTNRTVLDDKHMRVSAVWVLLLQKYITDTPVRIT